MAEDTKTPSSHRSPNSDLRFTSKFIKSLACLKQGWVSAQGEALETEFGKAARSSKLHLNLTSSLRDHGRTRLRPGGHPGRSPTGLQEPPSLLARISGPRRAAALLTDLLPSQLNGKSLFLEGSPRTALRSSGSHTGLDGTSVPGAPFIGELKRSVTVTTARAPRHPVAAPWVKPQAGVAWPNPHPGASSQEPRFPPDGGGDGSSKIVGAVPTSQVEPGPQLTSVAVRPASPVGPRPLLWGWPPCAHRAFCTEGSVSDRLRQCDSLREQHISTGRTLDARSSQRMPF